MNSIRTVLIVIVLFSSGLESSVCCAASPENGAELYRKHCFACHPDVSKLKPSADLAALLKNPPLPMPAFDEEKVSSREAQAIADFMRAPEQDAGKTAQAVVTPAAQPRPVAVAAAAPAVAVQPPVKTAPERRAEGKPARDKKSLTRGFVKKWTFKGLREGEGIAVQDFEIALDANDKLSVIPSVKLADYTVKVTEFEISDKTLKLQFTWSWKNAPSYWKTETYSLNLSDDGRKMTGLYSLRTGSGQNTSFPVVGE